jgi:hypothetical protein
VRDTHRLLHRCVALHHIDHALLCSARHYPDVQDMVQRVLNMATEESDNPDLRDRLEGMQWSVCVLTLLNDLAQLSHGSWCRCFYLPRSSVLVAVCITLSYRAALSV